MSGLPIRDGRIRDVTGESADREEGRAETTGAGATGRGCGIQAQQHLLDRQGPGAGKWAAVCARRLLELACSGPGARAAAASEQGPVSPGTLC